PACTPHPTTSLLFPCTTLFRSLTASELADAARPVLDGYYAGIIKQFHDLYDARTGQQRTTTDISDAARLATFGGIDKLLIDMDRSEEHTSELQSRFDLVSRLLL